MGENAKHTPAAWDGGSGWTDVACQKDRIVDWFGPSDFRRARTLLKEEANAE